MLSNPPNTFLGISIHTLETHGEFIIHIAKCKCSGRALGAKMKGRVVKINGFPFKYLHTRLIMCKTAKNGLF